MKKNSTAIKDTFSKLILAISLVFLSNFVHSQEGIKKMIRRSLDEKSFMKINNSKINHGESKDAILNFRDSKFGEKLVYDNSKGSESEIFAAINPADSNNIVIGVIHFAYNPAVDKPLEISIYYTNDFGDTWSKSDFNGFVDNSVQSLGGGDPVLVFDKQGQLHLTYILITTKDFVNFKSREYIYHAVSLDKGKTWEAKPYFESSPFNPITLDGADKFLDKQWMVSDFTSSSYSGNTYMGYVNFDLEEMSINIMVDVIKPDDTSFYYHPVKVSSDSFKFVQYASVDIDNDGNLYLGFVGSYDSIQYSFYNCVSKDGGETFSEPSKISNLYFPGFTKGSERSTVKGISDRYFPSPYIAIDKSSGANEGRIYATWTSPGIDTIEEGGSDIYLSYSDDGGNLWTKAIVVNNDSLVNSDQFYSSLEVNSAGIPILAFYDKREDIDNNNTEYYITYCLNPDKLDFSTQYAMTEKPSNFLNIGDKTSGFGIGEYNKIVSTEYFAIPFWSDGRKNTGDVNVYMARIPLDGKKYTVDVKNINVIEDIILVDALNPNPCSGIFNVNYHLKYSSKISFEVYDISGKKIYNSGDIKVSQGVHSTKIDLTNFTKGLYILKIKAGNDSVSKKIVIN